MQSVGKDLDFSGELKSEMNRSLLEAEARLSVAEKRVDSLERRADELGVKVAAEVRFRAQDSQGYGSTRDRLN